ncbi:hypothetical protein X798_06027 [Onchocerca flexuosa]|uniref:Uncharacterized protein n=1 Tax=Onchocerca flexuosa TaxID=387005 RepID=A0A238BP15_9BILA|nr:hypothetical protein X798_06027 [Onchocerca flexuosa]
MFAELCNRTLQRGLRLYFAARTFDDEVLYCKKYAANNWDYLFCLESKGIIMSNSLHITPRNRTTMINSFITLNLLPETQSEEDQSSKIYYHLGFCPYMEQEIMCAEKDNGEIDI